MSLNYFKNVDWHNHKRAAIDTFYMCVFTFLPTLFAIISIAFSDTEFSKNITYKAGEAFLYAISFFTSAFLIYNKLSFKLSELKAEFNIMILIVTILGAYCFSVINSSKTPNLSLINWVATICLLVSIISFYHSQLLNNRDSPNVRETRKDEQETIRNGLS